MRKEGYQESPVGQQASTRSSSSRQSEIESNYHRPSPLRTDPLRSDIPPRFPYNDPLSIGRSDLDPFPRGSNPFAPPSLFPPTGGDGMLVGPDHPIFGGGLRDPTRGSGMRGPWGGDGYLPPIGAPPGARFDPVGPDLRTFPRPAPRRQGDPDNDEFMPPGAVSF